MNRPGTERVAGGPHTSADAARAALAGAASFAAVFVAGFALGTVRVLLVEPRVGAIVATLFELPVMLAVSWWVVGWAIRRWRVARAAWPRIVMGSTALALLLGTETLLGVYGFGRSFAVQLQAWTEAAGLLGLAAQIAFGCMPLVRR
jgi:hypothetical protein